MSVAGLLERLQALKPGENLDFSSIRDDIVDEFSVSSSIEERIALLSIYKLLMDHVEQHIRSADLAIFRKTRQEDYNLLLISECIVGNGDVSPEALATVTAREVAAGRMQPDDELRKLAEAGSIIFSPASLVEKSPAAPRSGWRKAIGWLSRRG